MIRPAHAAILLAAFLAACASAPDRNAPLSSQATRFPTPFSVAAWHDGLPDGWRVYKLLRFKPLTRYERELDGGTPVVHARALNSVSGIEHPVNIDLHEYPVAEWRWKVPKLIENADNTQSGVADAPARVIFTFEGGREQLPPHEQLNYDLARAFTGNALPYATLMYIWEPDRNEGDIITHHNSTRVKMVIAGNATRDLSRWHEAKFNVLEDYRRAFGEEPPRVMTVGIMSDSDSTGSSVEAFFGDIRFLPK
jgi:hypothetical protein